MIPGDTRYQATATATVKCFRMAANYIEQGIHNTRLLAGQTNGEVQTKAEEALRAWAGALRKMAADVAEMTGVSNESESTEGQR